MTFNSTEITQNTKPQAVFQHIQEQLTEFHVSPVNNTILPA